MPETLKNHAQDFLIPFSEKDNIPVWLQKLIQTAIDTNGLIDDEMQELIFQELLNEYKLTDLRNNKEDDHESIEEADIQNTEYTEETDEIEEKNAPKVILNKLTHISGVNALLENQDIPFSESCTIVYGLNGAGKSGYFRILHELVGGEKKEQILGNVHKNDEAPFNVQIDYSLNGDNQPVFNWNDKTQGGFNEFSQIRVFDSGYTHFFLDERENIVDLEPMGLHIFNVVIGIMDSFKDRIVEEKQNISDKLPDIQTIIEEINSPELINMLNGGNGGKLDNELLNKYSVFSEEDESKLQKEKTKKTTLEKENKSSDIKLIESNSQKIKTLYAKLETLKKTIDDIVLRSQSAVSTYLTKEEAAKLRLSELEILKNIPERNSQEWLQFIKSGKAYKSLLTEEAEICPYCRQDLKNDALAIVHGYASFLANSAQTEFDTASTVVKNLLQELTQITVQIEISTDIIPKLSEKNEEDQKSLKEIFDEIIVDVTEKKDSLKTCLEKKTKIKIEDFSIEVEGLITELKNIETEFNESLKSLKSSDSERQEAVKGINEIIADLEDKKVISKKKDIIKKYFKDEEIMGTMDYVASTINTTPLSVLCGKATDELVTEDFRNNFIKELKELEKEHLPVEIPKGSVRKGKNKTRKQIKGHELKAILSEGEQKAVALALFLAEISKDANSSPLILDDPVNSLDHQVIDVLAKKLIQISSERQTIIFTHNKLFYDSLVHWASNLKNEQNQRTHHLCKNYNGGCNANGSHVYSFKIERISLLETGKVISKSQESSKFYLEKIEKDLQGDYTPSSIASDLKSTIEYYIDEKILNNQRLIKDYGNKQSIKWDQLKKLNPDEMVIDKLKEYWDLLSSRGSHLSANSMENPIPLEKFTEIIDFLKK